MLEPYSIEFILILGVPKIIYPSKKLKNTPNPPKYGVVFVKLIGHLIAASVIVFYGNITLNNITAFGFNLDFGIFAN